jgi:hypothetical protein
MEKPSSGPKLWTVYNVFDYNAKQNDNDNENSLIDIQREKGLKLVHSPRYPLESFQQADVLRKLFEYDI